MGRFCPCSPAKRGSRSCELPAMGSARRGRRRRVAVAAFPLLILLVFLLSASLGACSSASKRSGDGDGAVAEEAYYSSWELEVAGRRRCGSGGGILLQLGICGGGVTKAGQARVIAADMPEPVRWLPPKMVLPGCVAIAVRTRFSCYLAGAKAVDNTAAKSPRRRALLRRSIRQASMGWCM
uniref:Uncharacterized protein n=1 Tax=Oryza nivara TaxID=4536 RepID=A0A0E0GYD1_ORYNI